MMELPWYYGRLQIVYSTLPAQENKFGSILISRLFDLGRWKAIGHAFRPMHALKILMRYAHAAIQRVSNLNLMQLNVATNKENHHAVMGRLKRMRDESQEKDMQKAIDPFRRTFLENTREELGCGFDNQSHSIKTKLQWFSGSDWCRHEIERIVDKSLKISRAQTVISKNRIVKAPIIPVDMPVSIPTTDDIKVHSPFEVDHNPDLRTALHWALRTCNPVIILPGPTELSDRTDVTNLERSLDKGDIEGESSEHNLDFVRVDDVEIRATPAQASATTFAAGVSPCASVIDEGSINSEEKVEADWSQLEAAFLNGTCIQRQTLAFEADWSQLELSFISANYSTTAQPFQADLSQLELSMEEPGFAPSETANIEVDWSQLESAFFNVNSAKPTRAQFEEDWTQLEMAFFEASCSLLEPIYFGSSCARLEPIVTSLESPSFDISWAKFEPNFSDNLISRFEPLLFNTGCTQTEQTAFDSNFAFDASASTISFLPTSDKSNGESILESNGELNREFSREAESIAHTPGIAVAEPGSFASTAQSQIMSFAPQKAQAENLSFVPRQTHTVSMTFASEFTQNSFAYSATQGISLAFASNDCASLSSVQATKQASAVSFDSVTSIDAAEIVSSSPEIQDELMYFAPEMATPSSPAESPTDLISFAPTAEQSATAYYAGTKDQLARHSSEATQTQAQCGASANRMELLFAVHDLSLFVVDGVLTRSA